MNILMLNFSGTSYEKELGGKSAFWNKNGELIKQLDDQNQGILIYDTEYEQAEIHQSKIEKGQLSNLDELFQIYLNGKNELELNGIYQWTINYPTISIIETANCSFTFKNSDQSFVTVKA